MICEELREYAPGVLFLRFLMFVARQALSGCIDYCFGNSIYWFILPAQIFERYFNLSRQRSIRKFHYNDLAILVLKFTRVAYK